MKGFKLTYKHQTTNAADLSVGDQLKIKLAEIDKVSEPAMVYDYSLPNDDDKLELDYYNRLKSELIKEGQ